MSIKLSKILLSIMLILTIYSGQTMAEPSDVAQIYISGNIASGSSVHTFFSFVSFSGPSGNLNCLITDTGQVDKLMYAMSLNKKVNPTCGYNPYVNENTLTVVY